MAMQGALPFLYELSCFTRYELLADGQYELFAKGEYEENEIPPLRDDISTIR
jgi:hypothetical protein